MNPLTSVATASDSRQDVSSPYTDYSTNPLDRMMSPSGGPGGSSPRIPQGSAPYSPGGRSDSARRQSQQKPGGDGFDMQSPTGEIPMQSFHDGMPPAPPVSSSWRRINSWAEDNYPELFDQLCEGCTTNDINELEHILDCSLPNDVRESLQVHDGQERGGNPTGIIFGCMLLDCEEITQEWDNWRRVNSEYLSASAAAAAAAARANAAKVAAAEAAAAAAIAAGNVPGSAGPSSVAGSARSSIDGNAEVASVRSASSNGGNNGNTMWRQELLARQDCVPAGAVQKAYAHPAWIPLVRDWGGNNLAVDLAPGPRGTWGQVVMFGRDYDTKYVVARSWAHFLALVADDLGSGKWFIDEDSNELKLREFKSTRVEPAYLDILRWRMDQKYQRRANQNKRKSVVPGTNGSPTGSPYASPADASGTDSRGRQLQRLSLGSPLASPNRLSGTGLLQHGSKMSPLARVTEETSLPELNMTLPTHEESETIVQIPTPRPTRAPAAVPPPPKGKSKMSTVVDTLEEAAAATETEAPAPASTAATAASTSKKTTLETADDEDEGAMKTIEI